VDTLERPATVTQSQRTEIEAQRQTARETRRATVPAMEALLYEPIPVLDHGFIRVIDYMGDDAAIVQAARVSYGAGTKKVREDAGLINYLMRHRHTSPFEMCELKLHVKLPIFVARQWIRHRTACLAGDTELWFDPPNGIEHGGRARSSMTLERFHREWHGGENVDLPDRLSFRSLRHCDETTGEIDQTRVLDVWQTGVRPVFKVILANGYAVKMTKDHRCLTADGWRTLEQATAVHIGSGGTTTWRADAPRFAVNGVAAHRDTEWLKARRAEGLAVEEIADRAATAGKLVRGWSAVERIEYVGEEMTYDIEVAGPDHNFVANGFIVHNSVNEYSARYSILDREFYVPAPEQLAVQATSNRQGRGDVITGERAQQILDLLRTDADKMYSDYEQLLNETSSGEVIADGEQGLARELARMNLSVNFYTQWYWKTNLHNLLNFLSLRADAHAQYEIRVYAEALIDVLKQWVPHTQAAFMDYRMGAYELSAKALAVVKRLLKGEQVDRESSGMSPGEWRELMETMER
jgi:flavin-dependent thymidylate synthase